MRVSRFWILAPSFLTLTLLMLTRSFLIESWFEAGVLKTKRTMVVPRPDQHPLYNPLIDVHFGNTSEW